jgi:hypothetical protein
MAIKNILNQRFGKLVVVEFIGLIKKHAYWKCLCDCGQLKIIRSGHLNYGASKSCGCTKFETKNLKHGKSRQKIYQIWLGMKNRCYYPENDNYKWYGGRGIKVSDEWHDFINFYNDMGDPPENMTLDRIDVNGDYSKDNCRWATWEIQAKNKQKNAKTH